MLVKEFEPRLYQQTIFHTCTKHNTLVVLPTGLGKTAICVMLAAHRKQVYPKSKILVVAPTKPLLDQHYKTFVDLLEVGKEECVVLSGSVLPEKRKELWEKGSYFFSTPQTIENDVLNKRISMADVSLLCVDEAHRAVGDYSYVFLTRNYLHEGTYPRVLGLTASPGGDLETIHEVIGNLGIEKIEARSEEDPDVKSYVQDVRVHHDYVALPDEYKVIKKFLEFCTASKLQQIKQHGLLKEVKQYSKSQLLGMQASFQQQIATGEKDFAVLKSISLVAEVMKIEHALDMIECQGVKQCLAYMENLEQLAFSSTVKAVKNLVNDPNWRAAYLKCKNFADVLHPKMVRLIEIVNLRIKNLNKMIVFTQYRDTALQLEELLNKNEGVRARVFFGQATKKGNGMSQKEQMATLEAFKNGEYNVLLMTSVGEEGLDIPQVDLVVFYEPVPSAIRSVQRRGRTGRLEKGEVIVLIGEGTRDERMLWSAKNKEKRMHRNLEELQKFMPKKEQRQLNQFEQKEKKELVIYADSREKHSDVLKKLFSLTTKLEVKRLDVADYLVSDDVAIERKSVKDFVDSLVDGRLLEQLRTLVETYSKPVIIVEGEEDIYNQRNVQGAAIRGMISTIIIDYRVPLIWTKNSDETVAYIMSLASREQDEGKSYFSPHPVKPKRFEEQQLFIVSSFPMISLTLATEILKKFGNIQRFMSATEDELREIPNLGEKKAKMIIDLLNREFK